MQREAHVHMDASAFGKDAWKAFPSSGRGIPDSIVHKNLVPVLVTSVGLQCDGRSALNTSWSMHRLKYEHNRRASDKTTLTITGYHELQGGCALLKPAEDEKPPSKKPKPDDAAQGSAGWWIAQMQKGCRETIQNHSAEDSGGSKSAGNDATEETELQRALDKVFSEVMPEQLEDPDIIEFELETEIDSELAAIEQPTGGTALIFF